MKVLALTIIICLEILHGQKITRPDPPPGYNNKNPSSPDFGQDERTTGSRGSVCSTKSCAKWVYCVNTGMWKLVNQNNCPAVFHDHDFSDHQTFCSNPGNLPNYYDGSPIWHFTPPPPPFTGSPQWHFCAFMPSCFCEAC